MENISGAAECSGLALGPSKSRNDARLALWHIRQIEERSQKNLGSNQVIEGTEPGKAEIESGKSGN
jgi:hypothetical protein